jgi:hypothetical protein
VPSHTTPQLSQIGRLRLCYTKFTAAFPAPSAPLLQVPLGTTRRPTRIVQRYV